MNKNLVKSFIVLLASASMMFSAAADADAGKAIFVYGKAFVTSPDGVRVSLLKGSSVKSGDTVSTTSNGRVQLQMADGGLLALRPGTDFLIEAFQTQEKTSDNVFAAEAVQPRSFFVLLKGGFRSITGAIGQENKANYRVKTPVATIGIRGTDYDAIYCASDCAAYSRLLGQTVNDGLYVGVNSGGVNIATDSGSLDLNVGEFGYTFSSNSIPTLSDVASKLFTRATSGVGVESSTVSVEQDQFSDQAASLDDSLSPDTGLVATDAAGNPQNLVDGGDAIASPDVATGGVAFSRYAGSTQAGVVTAASAAQVRDTNDNVVGFADGDVTLALEQSTPVNVGRDENRDNATGLVWGRWESGNLTRTDASGSQTTAIDSSIHYMADAAGSVAPVVPTTGSANFALVGNTDPTDNRGNVGALGSANLSADFTSQTVDADVSLSFQETAEVWAASATDVNINSSEATFAGQFDSVTVSGADGDSTGNGDLSGFFTGDDAGAVNGAGMSFSLSEGATQVDGTAAFQRND